MISIGIPGGGTLSIGNLVLDYNGTMALDGHLIPGVADRLERLSSLVTLHVVTADTFGIASESLEGLPVTLTILPAGKQTVMKKRYVTALGAGTCASIGNGSNDALMLRRSALGIFVIGPEGGACPALREADIVCCSILDALDLLLYPKRLQATLRR